MQTRRLTTDDVEAMWAINEEGLPGTGQVAQVELAALLGWSSLSMGCFENGGMLGFVICLPPGTDYGSLNYAWFDERYDAFVYVDRIAVAEVHRNKGVGSHLYNQVVSYAQTTQAPVAAEGNLEPPNPGSMRFHERCAFEEVGVLHHDAKSVSLLLRT